MSRTMTLGKRIALGIAIMLVLMMVVGTAGYLGLGRVSNTIEFYHHINNFERIVASIKGQTDQYILALYNDNKNQGKKAFKEAVAQLDRAMEMVGEIKKHPLINTEGEQKLNRSRENLIQYRKALTQYAQSEKVKNQLASEIQALYENKIQLVRIDFN